MQDILKVYYIEIKVMMYIFLLKCLLTRNYFFKELLFLNMYFSMERVNSLLVTELFNADNCCNKVLILSFKYDDSIPVLKSEIAHCQFMIRIL